MSPYKPQHAVSCAHCRERTAEDLECAGCRMLVCRPCHQSVETCRSPRARVMQLGRGARLRHVDGDAEIGLVSTWTRKLRLFDLRDGRYVADIKLARWTTETHRLVLERDGRVRDERESYGIDRLARCVCGDHTIAVRTEHITVEGAGVALRPLPRSIISRVAYDCSTRLLAVASHDRLVAFRGRVLDATGDDGDDPIVRFERIGSVRVEGEPVSWLATAADRVVAITLSGRAGRLRGYRCATGVFYPLPFYEWRGGQRPEVRFRPTEAPPSEHAPARDRNDDDDEGREQFVDYDVPGSLSADGRFAALALDDSATAVHDLDRGESTIYRDHSDGLTCVAMSRDGQRLVTADHDNRVIVRERDGHRFARWLVS